MIVEIAQKQGFETISLTPNRLVNKVADVNQIQ